jgi:pimeloyl-ACP methyl ester carboxylesterase
VKGELIRTQTSDGLELAGLLCEPASPSRGIAVLHLHGATSNFYRNHTPDELADRLMAAGFAFLTANTRGHDIVTWVTTRNLQRSALLGNAYEVFTDCLMDVRAWLDRLEQRGWGRVVLQGHSYGAMKAAYYLAQTQDPRVVALSLLSPADRGHFDTLSGVQAVQQRAAALVAHGQPLQLVFFESGILGAQRILDSRNQVGTNVFNFADPAHPWTEIGSLRVPVFLLFGTEREVISVPPAQALAIVREKVVNCPAFTGRVIAGAPHNYRGFEAEVAQAVVAWVSSIDFPGAIL